MNLIYLISQCVRPTKSELPCVSGLFHKVELLNPMNKASRGQHESVTCTVVELEKGASAFGTLFHSPGHPSLGTVHRPGGRTEGQTTRDVRPPQETEGERGGGILCA